MTEEREAGRMNQREDEDILKSTQTIIRRALEKLGYSEEVYELLKEPLGC